MGNQTVRNNYAELRTLCLICMCALEHYYHIRHFCSERRRGGASQARRGLWGRRRTESNVHFFKTIFHCIFGFFISLQLLWLAGALVRNLTLLIDSRGRRDASKWNESESFIFVSSRLCSFLYLC